MVEITSQASSLKDAAPVALVVDWSGNGLNTNITRGSA
jgi:hypothetical protein